MIDFKNKKILITGATGGIGYNLVKKFHNLGAKVIGSGTNEVKLDNLKKEFDYNLINDNFETTFEKIKEIINRHKKED